MCFISQLVFTPLGDLQIHCFLRQCFEKNLLKFFFIIKYICYESSSFLFGCAAYCCNFINFCSSTSCRSFSSSKLCGWSADYNFWPRCHFLLLQRLEIRTIKSNSLQLSSPKLPTRKSGGFFFIFARGASRADLPIHKPSSLLPPAQRGCPRKDHGGLW